MTFLTTLTAITLCSSVPLLVYALTAAGKRNFRWWIFFATTKNRLIILQFLNIVSAVIVTAWPEARPIIPGALNLIGGFLVAVIPGISDLMSNLNEAVLIVVGDIIIGLMNGSLCVAALRGKNK